MYMVYVHALMYVFSRIHTGGIYVFVCTGTCLYTTKMCCCMYMIGGVYSHVLFFFLHIDINVNFYREGAISAN